MSDKKILVTGCCGFIGFHLTKFLLKEGIQVVGLDDINTYYSTQLKKDRLKLLGDFNFYKIDITNQKSFTQVFEEHDFEIVIHLAAQAGVRNSILNPHDYIQSNLVGFANILENCRNFKVKHLIYASSSSVYGMNSKIPFSEKDRVDQPVSLYAATKKSNELMAHSYSHLYGFATTGLRFFTVYGPYGRPDMAYYKFTKAIFDGESIEVFNDGNMYRDFTYIDDIIYGINSLIYKFNEVEIESVKSIENTSKLSRIFNIGNNNPVKLLTFIETLEGIIGKSAKKVFLPMHDGDVLKTYADIDSLSNLSGFKPITNIESGLESFVHWYKDYYKI